MDKRVDKHTAAKMLGRSVRVLQRYVKAGKLSVSYKRGKTGLQSLYKEDELRRLKEELEQLYHKPAISTELQPAQSATPMPAEPTQLINSLADAIGERLRDAVASLPQIEPVRLAEKLTLTMPEAAALSGLPKSALQKAIKLGLLKAFKIDGAPRIKRAALEKFIRKL